MEYAHSSRSMVVVTQLASHSQQYCKHKIHVRLKGINWANLPDRLMIDAAGVSWSVEGIVVRLMN